MLNVKQAYSIVKKNNPGMRALTCVLEKDCYVFSLIPNDLVASDGFVNGTNYTVHCNTGAYNVRCAMEFLGNPILKEFDVDTLE